MGWWVYNPEYKQYGSPGHEVSSGIFEYKFGYTNVIKTAETIGAEEVVFFFEVETDLFLGKLVEPFPCWKLKPPIVTYLTVGRDTRWDLFPERFENEFKR